MPENWWNRNIDCQISDGQPVPWKPYIDMDLEICIVPWNQSLFSPKKLNLKSLQFVINVILFSLIVYASTTLAHPEKWITTSQSDIHLHYFHNYMHFKPYCVTHSWTGALNIFLNIAKNRSWLFIYYNFRVYEYQCWLLCHLDDIFGQIVTTCISIVFFPLCKYYDNENKCSNVQYLSGTRYAVTFQRHDNHHP